MDANATHGNGSSRNSRIIIWCAVTTTTARDMSHFGFELNCYWWFHGRQSFYCNVQCILENILILSRSVEVFKFSSFKIHIIYVTNNIDDVIVQLTVVICYANGLFLLRFYRFS